MPCPNAFVQGADPYLINLGLDFTCYLDSTQMAVLDENHRVRINFESFFFSSPEMLQKFDASPLEYVEFLTDPVTHQRFRPGDDPPMLAFEDTRYYFLSDSTMGLFTAMPDSFALPNYKM